MPPSGPSVEWPLDGLRLQQDEVFSGKYRFGVGRGSARSQATEPGHYKVRLRSISHHNLTAVYDRDIHNPRCPLRSPVLGTVPG